MLVAAIAAMAVTIVTALAWRNAWAPAVGALAGVAIVVVAGAAEPADLEGAARELWRPLLVIVSIMATATCAGELGVFGHMAGWIEPRTRGPVKHAFRLVFVLAALCAAVLSNDAAILMFTPVVIELLRHVYPKRNPKFLVPFAFAVFVAAGVAPLPTGNPMNLVVATRAGIRFHEYALHMIPVALAGWLVAYAALAWYFRDALSDQAPALGKRPDTVLPVDRAARIVLVATAASILAYPILALVGWPLWRVAVPTAIICIAATTGRKIPLRAIAGGISWELLPFVFGVFVLATVLARAGVTTHLADLYASTPAPLATVGGIAAMGSAVINNHPMALIHSVTLAGAPDALVYAALIGGDLGPRLLPIGSLAGLLWLHALRRRGVEVGVGTFIRVGLVVTIPSLAVSLLVLWLVQ
jgi:arsenical pump membrane protein